MFDFFQNFQGCLEFFVNFGTNKLFAIFCIVLGQKQLEQKYIHAPWDSVEFTVYRVLSLGIFFSILIFSLDLVRLGFSLFSIFFKFRLCFLFLFLF